MLEKSLIDNKIKHWPKIIDVPKSIDWPKVIYWPKIIDFLAQNHWFYWPKLIDFIGPKSQPLRVSSKMELVFKSSKNQFLKHSKKSE